MNTPRNTEYDPFARVYNRYWGVEYRAEALPIVSRLLLSRLKPGAAVLDVCCGTGQFSEMVRRAGFDVAGIDASDEMIRYARENAPKIRFRVADARRFSLRRLFDGAYSVFESLNHVPDIADLERAFRCVRRHLRPGAPFLFDLNRWEAFVRYWNTVEAVVEEEDVCILNMSYHKRTRMALCLATAFERGPDSTWTRRDFTLRQTCHIHDEVVEALHAAGFGNVTFYDARDAGMRTAAGFARTFFLAI